MKRPEELMGLTREDAFLAHKWKDYANSLETENAVLMKLYEAVDALETGKFGKWADLLWYLRQEFKRAKKVLEKQTDE